MKNLKTLADVKLYDVNSVISISLHGSIKGAFTAPWSRIVEVMEGLGWPAGDVVVDYEAWEGFPTHTTTWISGEKAWRDIPAWLNWVRQGEEAVWRDRQDLHRRWAREDAEAAHDRRVAMLSR